ncbi:MAG: hypothetical protein ACJ74D_00260 [Gaiellaceae bacterium]
MLSPSKAASHAIKISAAGSRPLKQTPALVGTSSASAQSVAHASARDAGPGTTRDRSPQRAPWQFPGAGAAAAFGGAAGGVSLFFVLISLFLLAIPTAVRWLRPAAAQGMSPAFVALSDPHG